MALVAVVLDASPLGLISQRTGASPDGDNCRAWMEALLAQGVRVYVPEIADYEVRRELIRSGKKAGVARLDSFKQLARYVPITTDAMLTAAELWAKARNAGVATADVHAVDGDVIVAAQAISLRIALSNLVVATNNVRHISRFVPAKTWQDIKL